MTDREFLRHVVATVAYRAAKTMRGAPESFATFRPVPTASTPVWIVGHLADLFEFSRGLLKGDSSWDDSELQDWETERDRFFAALERFDDYLASDEPIRDDLCRVFQGPIADALTHVGQLAMLRRLSGAPMKGESYRRSDIVIGRLGFEQTPADPRYEFD